MRKYILRFLSLILILCVPAINIYSLYTESDAVSDSSELDLSLLEELDGFSLSAVKKHIDVLQEEKRIEEEKKKKEEERLQVYKNFMNELNKGEITFRGLFADVLIVGDSLMEALAMSDVLDSANIISQVSASLFHLEENLDRIVANNPEKLVLHYGINMLEENDDQLNWYISMYEELLIEIKERLPDTKIYISGIFMILEDGKFHRNWIEKYNSELVKLCEKNGLYYLDNSELLPGDGSYYGTDGIHLQKSFYREKWLPHLYLFMEYSSELNI